MKRLIIKFVARYFYPQYIFGKAIVAALKEKEKVNVIIDAPCGNGETAYYLSKVKRSHVFGYDISAKSIENAKENFSNQNLHFEVCDIFQVFKKHRQIDVFCMINSLFLLPEQDLLLKSIHETIHDDGWLVLILPNIHGRNYRNFIKDKNNSNINTLVLDSSRFADYFKERHFSIKKMKGIAYTHNYGRLDVKIFSVFSHFYLLFLNFFQSFFKINRPNYFLLVLTNDETS